MWPNTLSSHATPLPFNSGWNTALPRPKRRKIEIACEICRLRKSRCDGGRPKCGACIRRKNVSPFCVYSEHPLENLATPLPPATAFTTDHSTPTASLPLQYSPSARQRSVPDSSNGISPRTSQQHEAMPFSNSRHSPSEARTVSDSHQQTVNESKDETVRDDASGNDSNWILKAGLLAASSSTNFFNTIFGTSETEKRTTDDQNGTENSSSDRAAPERPPDHPFVRQNNSHAAEYVLPTRKIADGLLELFFKKTYIQWIDRLRFMRWYEGLWTGDHEPEDPIEEQIHYANLNIIFALVYRTEPEQIAEDQDKLAQTYYLRAQKLLQLNLLELNRLDLVYALLLLTQWFQSENNVRACTSLVGLCILISRNIGLHVPRRIESFPSQYQREISRRAWHGCILMDRITAMISGQPLQISQDIARQTPMFEAIDDEYLGTGEAVGVQPVGQPPFPCFFLAFCQLHIILGDVLAQFHDGRYASWSVADVNQIITIDESLKNFSDTLPPQLRIEKYNQNKTNYTGPKLHLHARFLHIKIMLYRVFFLRAAENLKNSGLTPSTCFADAVTQQGLLTCVRTAQEILELIGSPLAVDDRGPQLIPQWWHIVTYVYTAATILIAAHIFPAVVEEITASSLASSIQKSFHILDHHNRFKESTQRCKTALAVLCERHVNPANVPPQQTPNGTWVPADSLFQGPDRIDAAEISADFGWDFTDPSDLFHGEGMESLLLNTNLLGWEMNDWS